jgi:endoglucanase
VGLSIGALGIKQHRPVLRGIDARWTVTYGHSISKGYLRTSGAQIVGADGRPVRLAGVNWYGFDCTGMVAGGLDHAPLDAICRRVLTLGFNVIRLPFSVQMVQQNPPITRFLGANPSLQGRTALQIMDAVIATAGRYGLKVILDNHRSDAGWSVQENGLWYTQAYPESVWIGTWTGIVQRYAGNDTVIGADLRNEPGAPAPVPSTWPQNGGALWGYEDPANRTGAPADWAAAATRAGNAILNVNPNLLIFVEGVRYDPAGPASHGGVYWPGGNLSGVAHAAGARSQPVAIQLDVPDRLVYSAHDYGPEIAAVPWCQLGSTATTPDACFAVWDQTWGFIAKEGIAPVWVGEFGTVNGFKPGDPTPRQFYTDPNNVTAQGNWFSYLVSYIRANGLSWSYWCLNGTQSPAPGRDPTQPDWYGVLDPTWTAAASAPLMARLQSIQ